MNGFPIIFASDLNCISSPIISFIAWKGLEYELAFAYIWGFNFMEENPDFPGAFGPRIDEGFNNIFESLSYFYNIEINRYFGIETEEVYRVIKENISNGMPSIIFTDMYNCPWTLSYKTNHIPHSCTVVGLDTGGGLFCIDSAPPCDGAVMDIQDFNESCRGCITINLDKYKINDFDWKSVLHDGVSRMYKNDTFSLLSKFVNSFANDFNVESELKTSNKHGPQSSHIVWRILRISGGRRLYGIFLKHLGERFQNDDLICFAKEMESISEKWKINQALILRNMHAPDKNFLNKIAGNFSELLELEEKTAKALYEL